MKELRIYQREPEIYTLGPGRRYCLWVQGCDRRCPGCVSVYSREKAAGYLMTVSSLALEIKMTAPEGLTISGGEPFLQAEALAEMLDILKNNMHFDTGVILYTGFTVEELENVPAADKLLQYIDLLIDGPYIRELDDGKSLRGSSNQRVIPLTKRYDRPEILNLYGAPERSVQVIRHGFGVSRVGVINNKDKNFVEVKS